MHIDLCMIPSRCRSFPLETLELILFLFLVSYMFSRQLSFCCGVVVTILLSHYASVKAVFSFFILKKIKISKIYVRFEKFQKYPPVVLWGATGPSCNFFLQICNEVHGRKKRGPVNGRQGPVTQPRGDRVPAPYISPGRHSLVI